MRNKIIYTLVGIIVLAAIIFGFIINQNDQDTTSDPEPNNSEMENDEQENDEQENETDDPENDEEEEEQIPITNFGKYVYYGEECLHIEDTLERGDCFQELGEEYIEWFLQEEKDVLYYPTRREQSHWEDVFYKEITENDELSELIATDYLEEYEDPSSHGTNYARGEKALDEYWYVFSNLIPKEYRESLKYIHWTDTGEDFAFAVGNKDIESMFLVFSHLSPHTYHPMSRYFLLHEYGHILSLNNTQVDYTEEFFTLEDDLYDEYIKKIEKECKTVFDADRCLKEDSYLAAFFEQFWTDINEDYSAIDWNAEKDYENFFFEYEDHFFNSYQGTSPAEDFADTFAYFIHTHSSETGNPEVKYQKIKFLYEYEELVELRTAILENLYQLAAEDGEEY